METVNFRKFNPGTFQSDEELIQQFVVRETELGLLLNILEANIASPSCQHILVVAPRGRGKTMMLARVEAEIRTNESLSSNVVPVRFMEESQEIFSLADFWLETLFYLARECGKFDTTLSDELSYMHASLAGQWAGTDLEDRARAAVLETADRVGKRLVLMVENLQTLNREVDQDFGWKLRKVLQSDPQVILLATATSRFRELDDAEHPFFELFRIFRLEPLTVTDCRTLWMKVSGDSVTEREMRPLQVLTGGDPRLLVIIGEFARHQSLRQLMEELVRLLDDHTEYFRGHLEAFPKTERRVYLALVDLWNPSRTAEIAARARLDIRTVSSLLGRLVERGAVAVDGTGKKRTYAATQRLYSIYYKLRRERDEAAIVRNLIHFMSIFYSEEELNAWSRSLVAEAEMWPVIEHGIEQAMRESPHIVEIFKWRKSESYRRIADRQPQQRPRLKDRALDNVLAAAQAKDFERAINIADHALEPRRGGLPGLPDIEVSLILMSKALAHWELGEHDREVEAYRDLVDRFSNSTTPEVRVQVANALWYKGARQKELGFSKAAGDTFRKFLELFEGSEQQETQYQVANSLFGVGQVEMNSGDNEIALKTFDSLIERYGSDDADKVQVLVLKAMIEKESLLEQKGAIDAADVVNQEIVQRFGSSSLPQVQDRVARQMVEGGLRRGRYGDSEGAILAFEEVVRLYRNEQAPWLLLRVLVALFNKGIEQGKKGEYQSAIATLDQAINEFGKNESLEFRDGVARAMVAKGFALEQMGEKTRAMDVYDEVVQRFRGTDREEMQVSIARALVNKGVLLGKLGKFHESISTFNELLRELSDAQSEDLAVERIRGMMNKAYALEQLRNVEGALSVYGEVIDQFSKEESEPISNWVIRATMNKGLLQQRIGNAQEAIDLFNYVVKRFGDSAERSLRTAVARALLHKGHAESGRENIQGAIDAWNEIAFRFGQGEKHEVRMLLAEALLNTASAQSHTNLEEQALKTCERLEEVLGDESLRRVPEVSWTVLWMKGKMCLIRKDNPGALDAFRTIFSCYQADEEKQTRDILGNVPDMIQAGIAERDLVDILASDERKAESLRPLIVALQMRAGEEVRAPKEVLEVAEDVARMIENHIQRWASDG